MHRCFIALELDEVACEALRLATHPFVKVLKAEKPRFLKQSDYHITLKFLGSIEQERVDAVTSALASRLSSIPRVAALWAGFGALPKRSKAHVLTAVLRDDDGQLGDLQRTVQEISSEHGFPPEERAFKPHVTLARFKKAVDLRQHLSLTRAPTAALELKSVALYESTLLPGGAQYSILRRFELR